MNDESSVPGRGEAPADLPGEDGGAEQAEEHRQHGREEGRVSTVLPSPPARQISLFPSSNGCAEKPHSGVWYGEFLLKSCGPNDLAVAASKQNKCPSAPSV